MSTNSKLPAKRPRGRPVKNTMPESLNAQTVGITLT